MEYVPQQSIHIQLKRIGDFVIPPNAHIPELFDEEIEKMRNILKGMEYARAMYQRGVTNDAFARLWLEELMRDTALESYTPRKQRPMHIIYFIKHPCVEGIKIGKTHDLPSRLSSIAGAIRRKERLIPIKDVPFQNGYSAVLHIGSGRMDQDRLEELIHFDLRQDRISGEWFDSNAVASWLGSFFPKSLPVILPLAEVQS